MRRINSKENNKIVDLNPITLVIVLYVNWLNNPSQDKDYQIRFLYKGRRNHTVCIRCFKYKYTDELKVNGKKSPWKF